MKYSLDFLAWCNRCLFKDDFENELKELGVPPEILFTFSSSSIWKNRPCILAFYQDNINYTEGIVAIEMWLEMMHKKWERY